MGSIGTISTSDGRLSAIVAISWTQEFMLMGSSGLARIGHKKKTTPQLRTAPERTVITAADESV
jgi:hypothetical protein